ncbi:MAG: type II secretion system protein [Syntrophomonadaceae bacterium]|jgi:type II secretory pathway pseudopilin PulG
MLNKLRNQKGTTLVEVIASLVIFCLLSISFLPILKATADWIVKGGNKTIACQYACAVVENLRAERDFLPLIENGMAASLLWPGHGYQPFSPAGIEAEIYLARNHSPFSNLWNVEVRVTWWEKEQEQEISIFSIIRE